MQLGDFVLDLKQQLLFQGQTEMAAEPKVYQLLIYLYQHRARYVSLEELHQQLWADRVVSDTAVRSTVKKLRLLLNDDQVEPVYLKSVSKRGYKLICAVNELPEFPSGLLQQDHQQVTEETLAAHGGYAAAPGLIASDRQPQFARKKTLLLCLGFLLLVVMVGWYSLYQTTTEQVHVGELSHITNFEGEKRSLTVSADGRHIAFTGRMSPEQDTQVYLFDRRTKHLRQLTTQAKNASFVSFLHDDKALAYTDSISGNSSIHLLPLTIAEPEQAVSTLVSSKYLIGDMTPGRHSAEILFLLQEQSETAAMVYSLDLNTKAISRVVTVSQPDTFIYQLQLSPNQQQLAFLKRQNEKNQLVILDLLTKNELKVVDLPSVVDGLVWRNNQQVILLDDHAIQLLDTVSGRMRLIHTNPEGLIKSMVGHNGQQLILIQEKKARADRLFIEQSLSADNPISRIIDVPAQVIAMNYSTAKQFKWLTLLDNNIYSIARKSEESRETEVIYQSQNVLEMLDIDESNQKLLIKENNRLLLISLKDGAVTYLTTAADLVSDAVFSSDKKTVLYGQQIAGRWEIMQYELQSSAVAVLFKGYRSARQSADGYVLADAEGQLFYIGNSAQSALNLAHRISFEPVTRWSVHNNKIIWTTFDYRQTSLHQLQLGTRHYQVMHRAYRSLYPTIAISPNAGQFLYLSVQLNDASLSLLPFIAE